MNISFPDQISLILSLAALLLVARLRKQISAIDKESYNYISSGLSILAVAAVGRALNEAGVFAATPFLSEPLFYRLLSWIVVITGVTLLISGVSNWLPLSRRFHQHSETQLNRLGLIKKVEQLVGVESRFPVLLGKTVVYMLEHCQLSAGSVYLFRRKTRTLVHSVAEVNSDHSMPGLDRISFDVDKVLSYSHQSTGNGLSLICDMPDGLELPGLVIPILVGRKFCGLILLWSPEPVGDEDRTNLKLATEILARKIQLDRYKLETDFYCKREAWSTTLTDAVDLRGDIKENISALASQIAGMIGCDLLSLTIIGDRNHAQRFTVGNNSGILHELSIDPDTIGTCERQVLNSRSTIIVGSTRDNQLMLSDKRLLSAGINSLIALPLVQGTAVRGVLMVASKESAQYSNEEMALLKAAVPVFVNLTLEEINRESRNQVERGRDNINRFLERISRGESLQSLFELAATMLSTELKSSTVRVSTYDSDGVFLRSRALSLVQTSAAGTPPDGYQVLSLMPYHRLVRDSGRMFMINQQNADSMISEAEATQAFAPELKFALMVPVKVKDKVVGIISLGELRNGDRFGFSQQDIQQVTATASALALAIQMNLKKPAEGDNYRTAGLLNSSEIGPGAIRSQVRSSLTGIMGSVEMMRSNVESGRPEELDRYLSIIDRSAQKISEYISG